MISDTLESEWSARNTEKYSHYKPMSNKEAYWECDKGHEWKAVISDRSRGTGCPYCSNKIILKGYNDLQTLHPEIALEWSLSNSKKPEEVGAGAVYKAEWVCDLNHKWIKPVYMRTKRNLKCPYCSNQKVLQGFNDLATAHPNIAAEWGTRNTSKPTEVVSGSSNKVYWECDKGHEWFSSIGSRVFYETGCPQCATRKYSSKGELELISFLESLNLKIEQNTRKIIPPFEIDAYIPSKSIAIEYNGLYWHSEEAGKDKWYHYNKWESCKNKNVQLITVWEDDWINKKTIVQDMIKHKLGLSNKERIYARKTEFCQISKKEAENFLNSYHIQGYKSITRNFGLKDSASGKIVSVISFSTQKHKATLERYATSSIVIGGFTKLLKNSIKELPISITDMVTFSDRTISDGSLYSNSGFQIDKELDPDYSYMYKDERCHKFLFRKSRFKNDILLKYDNDKTEKELAKMNNLKKIWDSGKIRWIMYKENR